MASARSGSAETGLGVGSRGSLGSSPRQLQHRLHHAGAVLGAGLAKQAAVGLGVAVSGSGALVTPGALRSCCSLWPVAVRGLCEPLLPGQAAAPSCSPPASMAVTAQCPAGWKGGMGLFGAGSLRPHWLPPIMPVLSLGAKCGSRPDTNTRKRENVGGSTPTFPGGSLLPGSSPSPACLIPIPQDRLGHSTSHPPEASRLLPLSWGLCLGPFPP